jgi:hypothetical protein
LLNQSFTINPLCGEKIGAADTENESYESNRRAKGAMTTYGAVVPIILLFRASGSFLPRPFSRRRANQ